MWESQDTLIEFNRSCTSHTTTFVRLRQLFSGLDGAATALYIEDRQMTKSENSWSKSVVCNLFVIEWSPVTSLLESIAHIVGRLTNDNLLSSGRMRGGNLIS